MLRTTNCPLASDFWIVRSERTFSVYRLKVFSERFLLKDSILKDSFLKDSGFVEKSDSERFHSERIRAPAQTAGTEIGCISYTMSVVAILRQTR
jgi:hypothetical protein